MLSTSNPWGQQKKGFYGRDKKRDDESSSDGDDEDEYQEAIRLQKVRAQKLQMQMKLQEGVKQAAEEHKKANSDEDEESSSDESVANRKTRGKLGDRLFADAKSSKEVIEREDSLKALLKQVKGKALQNKLLE